MLGRVEVEGRHLRLNGERFVVRGTTYGHFAPRADGARYPGGVDLRADFEAIVAMGLNTIQTVDVPPADLFAAATEFDLRVLVGLDYADWRFEPFPDRTSNHRVAAAGLAAVDRLFERIEDPAVLLAVSVGRALPADLARVHHPGAVADTLASIIDRVRTLDPSVPTTSTGRAGGDESATGPGCDLLSIVVGTECGATFEHDLVRLQLARPARPVVVTDLNPPSTGYSIAVQAGQLADRLHALDRTGCAGATVGCWVEDTPESAGSSAARSDSLVTADRTLTPLGRCVEVWARRDVKDLRSVWPRVTALVTTHNSESTVEQCLSALELSDYPDLEVIVCDEGSTDRTAALAARYPFELRQTAGSDVSGRSLGPTAGSGDIVAFVDADVICHRSWPWFVALAFDSSDRLAVVSDHLVDAGGEHSVVAQAASALADLDPLRSPGDLATTIATADGALAVRRSALTPEDLSTVSAGAMTQRLIGRFGGESHGDRLGVAPGAQAVRAAPDGICAVWRSAVARGRTDRPTFDPAAAVTDRRTQVLAQLAGAVLGARPSRPAAVRAILELLVPVAVAVGAFGAGLVLAGATGPGLVVAGSALGAVTILAGVVAADVNVRRRSRRTDPATTVSATTAIVLLEAIARAWGRLGAPTRPPAPVNRSWSGDRDHWLSELRWRLGGARLSVLVPGNRNRWDIEVRSGLFLRKLIVAAVAWQWTPHVRTGLRPRWSIVAPAAAATAATIWSPLIAAVILSATVGEVAFELLTLRRVDHIISNSIAGSLPAVDPVNGPPIERTARTTLDL